MTEMLKMIKMVIFEEIDQNRTFWKLFFQKCVKKRKNSIFRIGVQIHKNLEEKVQNGAISWN